MHNIMHNYKPVNFTLKSINSILIASDSYFVFNKLIDLVLLYLRVVRFHAVGMALSKCFLFR